MSVNHTPKERENREGMSVLGDGLSPEKSLNKSSKATPKGIPSELYYFLKNYKKWWLTPIILFLLCLILMSIFSETPVLPFIYRI